MSTDMLINNNGKRLREEEEQESLSVIQIDTNELEYDSNEAYKIGNHNIGMETLFLFHYFSKNYNEAKNLMLKETFNVNYLIGYNDSDYLFTDCAKFFDSIETAKYADNLYQIYRNETLFSLLLTIKDFNFIYMLIDHPSFNPKFTDDTNIGPIDHLVNVVKNRTSNDTSLQIIKMLTRLLQKEKVTCEYYDKN